MLEILLGGYYSQWIACYMRVGVGYTLKSCEGELGHWVFKGLFWPHLSVSLSEVRSGIIWSQLVSKRSMDHSW